MTDDDYQKRMNDPNWYGERDENGVDLSLIRSNLAKTPTERIRQGDKASKDALRIRANVRYIGPIKP